MLAKSIPWKQKPTKQPYQNEGNTNLQTRCLKSWTSSWCRRLCIVWVESNTAVSNSFSMCWCERWDFTCNAEHVNKVRRLLLSHIGCINLILQSKVQRSVTNNFSISEGPRNLLASGLRSPPTFGKQLTRADASWDRLIDIDREQWTENQKY